MKCRPRIILDAVQWFPGMEMPGVEPHPNGKQASVKRTPSGSTAALAKPGDWILTDCEGCRAVCDQEDFSKHFELLETP